MSTTRKLLRSVDGRVLPNLGEVAIYWPNRDCTYIYDTTGFSFTDEPDEIFTGESYAYPELIEHDAEATAKDLLACCIAALWEDSGLSCAPALREAIAKATGSQA